MDWMFNGIPIHPLLVHAVVILVPLAALCLMLSVAWPEARRRLGLVTPLVTLVALVSVPLATQAGEALQSQVESTELSRLHTQIGDHLTPWAIGLFAVAALQWAWFTMFIGRGRYADRVSSPSARTAVTVILIVLAVVVSVGSILEVVIIGESGARAVWDSRIG